MNSPIIVVFDFPDLHSAQQCLEQLSPAKCRIKIGKEMFTRFGPQFVEYVISQGFEVFLDLKYFDIPNTVAGACRAAAELGVWMVNLHALGGSRMMQAARQAIDEVQGHDPYLIAVTILTSMQQDDLQDLNIQGALQDNVVRLAKLAENSGCDGVVCSALEAEMLRQEMGKEFLLVTPGIRLSSSPKDDQKRIMTPEKAIAAGASYLVIGRPITQSSTPGLVLDEILLSCK